MSSESTQNMAVPSAPPVSPALRIVEQIIDRSDTLIRRLHEEQFEPSVGKTLERRYSITEVADMVGRSTTSIRKAEDAGHLVSPEKNELGRRSGYTLEAINAMRDYFGIFPGRQDNEKPFRLSFQNFKGGVGKTTLCCHFCQYMAQKGYRVLLVDCDSQGSSTTTFGYHPDLDLELEDTLMPFIVGDEPDLSYAVRATYWDRLDIIPANLELYGAEYHLAALAGGTGPAWINRLHEGLQTVENAYDIVVLDPPPALGMISLNVTRAMDGLIVPTPPAMYDFHSTVTFFRMMMEVVQSVGNSLDEPLDIRFVKLLVSKYDSGKSAQEFIVQMMSEHYAGSVLRAPMLQSAEIDNASSNWQTVYELSSPTTSRKTYQRCINSLNAVFEEIELLVRNTWPSHRDQLKSEGHSLL